MHCKVVVHKVVGRHHVVPAAAKHNTRHAIFKPVSRNNRAAELVVEVHSLHRRPPERRPLSVADVSEAENGFEIIEHET
jgi:hypothetical protein